MKCPILQVVRGENQVRPTVLVNPPSGGWHTILSVPITTTAATSVLDITASLGALVAGDEGTSVDAGIRVLVDGTSTGLGASQSKTIDSAQPEPLISVALVASAPVAAGTHAVELQWYAAGGGTAAIIGFINPDLDGCAMRVTECAP